MIRTPAPGFRRCKCKWIGSRSRSIMACVSTCPVLPAGAATKEASSIEANAILGMNTSLDRPHGRDDGRICRLDRNPVELGGVAGEDLHLFLLGQAGQSPLHVVDG